MAEKSPADTFGPKFHEEAERKELARLKAKYEGAGAPSRADLVARLRAESHLCTGFAGCVHCDAVAALDAQEQEIERLKAEIRRRDIQSGWLRDGKVSDYD